MTKDLSLFKKLNISIRYALYRKEEFNFTDRPANYCLED